MPDPAPLLDYREVRDDIQNLDVLAFRGRGFVSRQIRRVSGGDVTHVGLALWVGPRLMLLESREFRGGRIVWMSRELEGKDVLWYRPVDPLEHQDDALDWALRAMGAGYSYRGVVRFLLRGIGINIAAPDSLSFGNRFCSELNASVYRRGGEVLVPGKLDSEVTPADIAASPRLRLAGRLQVVDG